MDYPIPKETKMKLTNKKTFLKFSSHVNDHTLKSMATNRIFYEF